MKFWYSILNPPSLHIKFQVNRFIYGFIPQSVVSIRVLVSQFEMEKNFVQCVVMKFCAKFGFIITKMFKMVNVIYGESSVSCAMLKLSIQGEEGVIQRRGVKRRASNDKNGHKRGSSNSCCEGGFQVGYQMIEKTGILKTIMQQMLHDDLKKWKICARFMPHVLTIEQSDQQARHAENGQKLFGCFGFDSYGR